jgi:hypothetical protein
MIHVARTTETQPREFMAAHENPMGENSLAALGMVVLSPG